MLLGTRPWVVFVADPHVAHPMPNDSSRVISEHASVEEAAERAIRHAEDGE